MVATPDQPSSDKKDSQKKDTNSGQYAAPQQPEFWDSTSNSWVPPAARNKKQQENSGEQPKRQGPRHARRISKDSLAQARPYRGPLPGVDDQQQAKRIRRVQQSRGGQTGPGGRPGTPQRYKLPPSEVYRQRGAAEKAPVEGLYQPTQKPKKAPPTIKLTPGGIFRTVVILALTFVLLVVVGGLAGLITFGTNVSRVDALSEHMIGRTAGTNWLLVGSDSRSGMDSKKRENLGVGGDLGSQRTDVIMLMHIPHVGGQKVLVSIPRDSYVYIPGYGNDKINAAYAYGGPELLVKTFEQAAGVHVNHYMEIDFAGFAAMTDAIGGVTICPSSPINDPLADLNVDAGCQKADGKTALGYVRTRQTPRADLDRVGHQREFLNNFADEAINARTLLNPIKFFKLTNSAGKALTLDKNSHFFSLGRLAWAMSSDHVTTTLPIGELVDNESGAVVMWNDDTATFWRAIASGDEIPDYLISE